MRRLRVAIGLAAVLVGLVPAAALAAQAAPIHWTWDVTGSTDVCGVPVSYEDMGRATLVYNAQTNTVTVTSNEQSSLTGPNGKVLIDHTTSLQLITNVVNPDGSQSYTWTLPFHQSIKLADGGVLEFQAGILKAAATVYPDGTVTFAVTLDKGPRLDDFCGPIIAALTS